MTDARALYIRPSQAQQVFGISRATIYRWADAGAFKIHKRGNASFVKIADVTRYIEGGQVGDQTGNPPITP